MSVAIVTRDIFIVIVRIGYSSHARTRITIDPVHEFNRETSRQHDRFMLIVENRGVVQIRHGGGKIRFVNGIRIAVGIVFLNRTTAQREPRI